MIDIDSKISIPKYQQIINSIEDLIASGNLKKGDQLPSINNLREKQKVSRDTILIAFRELKSRGIIESVMGKGYYVLSENINTYKKIFLLFDELNSFKEDLYNSFIDNLAKNMEVDIFFHHFNKEVFEKLINEKIDNYDFYVIMPANLTKTSKVLKKISKDKIYILDQLHKDLKDYPSIYQNFEKAIYNNLLEVGTAINKYEKLVLVNSGLKQPKGLINGFVNFCTEKKLQYAILSSLKNESPEIGSLYIIPDDKNLLRIIKKSKQEKLELAKDFGIISFNNTLLKEIVEGGITTISTDFNLMGKKLAEMIKEKEKTQIENPSKLIVRNSL